MGLPDALVTLVLAAQDPTACTVTIANPSPVERTATVVAALPFGIGELRVPAGERLVAVDTAEGGSAPALVAFRWHDGSAGLLHTHLTVTVPARGTAVVDLRPRRGADDRAVVVQPTEHDPLLPARLPLWTELVDPWGRVLTARLEPDPTAGPDGVLWDTGALRARRFRSRHRLPADQGGHPLLELRAYLVTAHGDRRGTLTLVLDNEAAGLGAVRFGGFALVTGDDALRFLPANAIEQGMEPAEPRAEGGYRQWLLRRSAGHYLGDRTAKAFRIHLFQDGPEVTEGEREAARWMAQPLTAVPDLGRLRATRAFSAHGGPAPRDAVDTGLAGLHYRRWRETARFGPYAGFGDPEDGACQGTARNGPSALHNVVRWQSPHLAVAAEAMLLQHTLRPTPGRWPAQPADAQAYRQGLGPLARTSPHGFTAPDYEHFSVLLPYDWWWLTGDPLALDELRRLAAGLRGELAALPFLTARGEGWSMQSGVLIARATGDDGLLAFLRRRFLDEVLPRFGAPGRSYVLRQPAHRAAMDQEPFDAPWQMAALLHGLHALWSATDDAQLAGAMLRVADVMVGPGWVEGTGPKYFVSAVDSGRYTLMADPVTRNGVERMVAAGLVLAVEAAGTEPGADRLRAALDFLMARMLPPDAGPGAQAAAAANPWLQVVLDRRETR